MNYIPDTYYQPVPRTWKDRMLQNVRPSMYPQLRRNEFLLPSWMVGNPLLAFLVAFMACTFVFGHAMPLAYACVSVISVLLFLFGSKQLSMSLAGSREKAFIKTIFIWALGIRLIWVIFSYAYFNQETYGKVDGYGDDIGWYLMFAEGIAQWINNGFDMPISDLIYKYTATLDDVGYPIWLAIVNVLTVGSSDVFIPMILKTIFSAYSCICVYRVARRHFGEGTARLSALFMCFNPYLLLWCSSLLKETEMIFLCCVFINETDKALTSSKKMTFLGMLPGGLAGFALFFFRAPLAIVAFLSVMTHIVFASNKIIRNGKKVLMALLIGIVLLVGVGDQIRSQSQHLIETVRSGQQEENMQWRSQRKDATGVQQTFAKYAGAAVFAPLIFTIPFPTFNQVSEAQVMQLEMSGANYIKNMLSFFVIISLIFLLLSGEWRRHVFIIAYTVGYHLVLVMSNFAHSGRFHMPVLPMLMIFAAYGIQIGKNNTKIRKWFPMVLILEVAVCLVWNWFKLKGRGMI